MGAEPFTGAGSGNRQRRDNSPADGAARRRRSLSSRVAAATAARKVRRCLLPASRGTATVTADTAVKARNIHSPVRRASPTPRARGRPAASSSAALLPCAAGLATSNGAEASKPAPAGSPGSAVRLNTKDIVEPPHWIRESVDTAAMCTFLPSMLTPLTLPRSRSVTVESVTSSCACVRDSSASGRTTSVPLRPIRNRPRRSGMIRPAPGPLCTLNTRGAVSRAAAWTVPSWCTVPSTRTAPSTRRPSMTSIPASGTRSTVSSPVP